MANKLKNYLRKFRKKSDLSQDEIAFLLGGHDGAQISRYERLGHQPGLRAILAYECIFGTPVGELFAGLLETVKKETRQRARILTRRLRKQTPDKRTAHKLAVLDRLLADPGDESDKRE